MKWQTSGRVGLCSFEFRYGYEGMIDVDFANWGFSVKPGIRLSVRLETLLRRKTLYANPHRLVQRCHLVPQRHKLLPHVTLIAGVQDRLHDGRIIDFLGVVDFVATGIPRCVIMGDIRMNFLDPRDDVTLHDLDVINIEQNLHPLRPDLLANFNRRFQRIAKIIGMTPHFLVDP